MSCGSCSTAKTASGPPPRLNISKMTCIACVSYLPNFPVSNLHISVIHCPHGGDSSLTATSNGLMVTSARATILKIDHAVGHRTNGHVVGNHGRQCAKFLFDPCTRIEHIVMPATGKMSTTDASVKSVREVTPTMRFCKERKSSTVNISVNGPAKRLPPHHFGIAQRASESVRSSTYPQSQILRIPACWLRGRGCAMHRFEESVLSTN